MYKDNKERTQCSHTKETLECNINKKCSENKTVYLYSMGHEKETQSSWRIIKEKT